MVLDIYDEDRELLILKNTSDQEGQPKQVEVSRSDSNAPEELFFVHIEVKDMNTLPGQEERHALKKSRNGKEKK